MLFGEKLVLFFIDEKNLPQLRNLMICLLGKGFELFLEQSELIVFEMVAFTQLITDQ
jgi:hypothetical protein